METFTRHVGWCCHLIEIIFADFDHGRSHPPRPLAPTYDFAKSCARRGGVQSTTPIAPKRGFACAMILLCRSGVGLLRGGNPETGSRLPVAVIY